MFIQQFLDFPFPDKNIESLLSCNVTKEFRAFKLGLWCQENLQLYELVNIKQACDYIIQLTHSLQGRFIVEECILETNRILLDGLIENGGVLSTLPRYTSRYHPTFSSKESFSKALLFLCDIVSELLREISVIEDRVLQLEMRFKVASFFFCVFLELHPFPDGNGRTATLLMNYLLDLPFFVIVSTDRQSFLRAVEASRSTDVSWEDYWITEDQSVKIVFDIAKNCKPFYVCELLILSALRKVNK